MTDETTREQAGTAVAERAASGPGIGNDVETEKDLQSENGVETAREHATEASAETGDGESPSPGDDAGSLGEDTGTGDDDSGSAARTGRLRRWRWPALVSALGLVAALFAAAAVWFFLQAHAQHEASDARAQATAAARQKVLDLLTLSQNNAKQDVARVEQGTTGEFKNQFAQQTSAWEQVLTQGKVDSTGQIQESGVTSLSGDTAQVMVAASANVKNTQAPNGEQRQYRMMVTLQHVGDQWLVSKLEFVP